MRNDSLILAVLPLGVVVAAGCRPAADPEGALRSLLDAAVEHNELIRGVALHVDSPRLGLDWQGASGMADQDAGVPMSPANPVRIASNTKTFVAAAVLRLWEDGKLGLDDAISEHLSPAHLELLRGDGYDPEAMTIRHLLTHTSGLFDHGGADEYGEAIVADLLHPWTRTEQLRGAVEWGDPHGLPGEVYTYCDTGYILLGEIIERTTGQSLAEAVRQLVGYERLGLDATWWEILEPKPSGVPERAHQYLGDLDVTDSRPYYDLYGGGGIASTVGDMARFFRALFTGGVYSKTETLETMLTTVEGAGALADAKETALPPGAYRMGVWVVEVEGFTAYRHTGFWGTAATYVPDLDLAVAATINQGDGPMLHVELVDRAIAIAARARRP
jgi:D-alanyl-D-alanine carboxypeptidase